MAISKGIFKLTLIIFTCFLFSNSLKAQQIDLHGKVIDQSNGSVLIGVHIITNNSKGTVSDIDGFFDLKLQFGDTLKFSLLGYDSLVVYMNEFAPVQEIVFSMKEGFITLQEIGITGQYQANTILKREQLKKMKVPGIKYPTKPNDEYHMGVKKAVTSPVTAMSRVFSRGYKIRKNFVKSQIKKEKDDIEFKQASKKLTEVLHMTGLYLDDYYYRDFMYYTGLTNKGVIHRSVYDLITLLPNAVKRYSTHLEELEKTKEQD